MMTVCYCFDMDDDLSSNLAANVRQLRQARGLSQVQAAKLAELARPTWAHIETGAANPTLSVLRRIARALSVTIDELISPPRAACQHYAKGALPRRQRTRCQIDKLLPDPIAGMEFDRFELPPKAGFVGVPHTAGTREYLVCERGEIELVCAGESWTVGAGEVLAFRGDQRHSYRNTKSTPAVGYSVVAFAKGQ